MVLSSDIRAPAPEDYFESTWLASDLERFGPHVKDRPPSTLAQADRYCRSLAHNHSENFVVASWLLPRALRVHFYRIYAYCRWADDLADEIVSRDYSVQLLDWWQTLLEACYRGDAAHPVFVALRDTIAAFDLPVQPFVELLRAFRQDQEAARYEDFSQLLSYCRWSANPVGHLILYLARCYDEERRLLADSICTGLQLANFCQDARRDYLRGRIYFPREDFERFGCEESDFGHSEGTAAARLLMEFEVVRAEQFLQAGLPLASRVPRWLAVDIELFVRGGLEILKAIRRRDYDVWTRRPRVSRWRQVGLLGVAWYHAGKREP